MHLLRKLQKTGNELRDAKARSEAARREWDATVASLVADNSKLSAENVGLKVRLSFPVFIVCPVIVPSLLGVVSASLRSCKGGITPKEVGLRQSSWFSSE
jgi:hypothetical protein